MSVFKRLSNVAKGKMMEIGRNLSSDGPPDDEPDELDPDRPPRRVGAPEPSDARGAAPPERPEASRREMLEKLRAEGLLTDAEYEEKLAALDAPPPPPTRRKRRL
ncbi:MAG: hypothetical protein R3F61_31895 [Myxococcota bacterium]